MMTNWCGPCNITCAAQRARPPRVAPLPCPPATGPGRAPAAAPASARAAAARPAPAGAGRARLGATAAAPGLRRAPTRRNAPSPIPQGRAQSERLALEARLAELLAAEAAAPRGAPLAPSNGLGCCAAWEAAEAAEELEGALRRELVLHTTMHWAAVRLLPLAHLPQVCVAAGRAAPRLRCGGRGDSLVAVVPQKRAPPGRQWETPAPRLAGAPSMLKPVPLPSAAPRPLQLILAAMPFWTDLSAVIRAICDGDC